jgi:hypothetical protein
VKDLPTHLGLFTLIAVAIVVLGAMYAEPTDEAAARGLPRRLLYFFAGCALLTVVVLVLEHTVASVR